ncbi:DNA mismatch repair endonuclease MutL [Paenibacillus thalictri]|uniref:DNA mismatch repair protein MutL n=1 Tax=Paenibacillus thalictri TaxID=2527873 RepID=A0A4Q9DW18_9BACL|nr:DNA mismatch repair endonuclease MutL [Paenibacillus thalictri]TBL80189.1 DNA mismatch repair endonuclease MutL [Paenibacillus thalictri]
MGKIQILDEHVANQIAAGEVVERPSSVVKELVENAIDAGSTKIDVAIEEGGLTLIRVTDNGTGMDAADSEVAFFRHATSKIASGKDLFSIRTLGFRGEALPSIAAVSKVECTTSSDQSGLGRKIVIEGGTIRSVGETASPRGTDIAVRELFYNTPARLKYMKTIQTELSHVSDYMYRLALAHPGIAFTLRHNGNTLLQTLGNGDVLQVIAAVYGTSTAKNMLPIQGENLDYTIRGYISKPEFTRASRSGISTVINGRYIRNYAVAQALLTGYHTLLPINRFPLAVLHVNMSPELVDVNVHPSKLEVRFSKEQELIQFISQQAHALLNKQVLIPSVQQKPKAAAIQEQMELYRPQQMDSPQGDVFANGRADQERGTGGYAGSAPSKLAAEQRDEPVSPRSYSSFGQQAGEGRQAPEQPGAAASSFVRNEGSREGKFNGDSYRQSGPGRTAESFARNTAPAAATSAVRANEAFLQAVAPDPEEAPPALPAFPVLTPIGQLHGTYIVAQNEEGLFLMDQHAAHERINYEKYYELFGRPQTASQELLVPITLEFTSAEAERLKSKLQLFEQAGVYLDYFGGNTFIVRAYPHWMPQGEEQAIIEEMVEWALSERKSLDIAKLREKAAIMCSCKASIKANFSLSLLEMEALFDKLAACKNPYTCPHGRPIVISFSTYELEKMFKRVM